MFSVLLAFVVFFEKAALKNQGGITKINTAFRDIGLPLTLVPFIPFIRSEKCSLGRNLSANFGPSPVIDSFGKNRT